MDNDNSNNGTNIVKYYNSIDKDYINDLCKNASLKNLLNLSIQTELCVFNKNRSKLKNKNILLKEFDKIKKKEIKKSSDLLLNLAKIYNNTDLIDNKKPLNDEIKNIYKKLEDKITNIDDIIRTINIIDINNVNKKTTYKVINDKVINDKVINNYERNNIININLPILSSEDYIEYYSNC